MNEMKPSHRVFLLGLASDAMIEMGFKPEFSKAAVEMANGVSAKPPGVGAGMRDARGLPWCSIDNDDSLDLDQLTAAEEVEGGRIKIFVAVADVGSVVEIGSPIDEHAHNNTTSVYTAPRVFPMLPERLSTDLTSLNPGVDRAAFVAEAVISRTGEVEASDVYRAIVRSRAKLAYPAVGLWLAHGGLVPEAMASVPGLAENVMMQNTAAQLILNHRHEQGALDLVTLQVKAVFKDDDIDHLQPDDKNLARDLIENFMIVANGVVARFLTRHRFPVLRRVVRSPDRWERIRDIAADLGRDLPAEPDVKALQAFLSFRRSKDPVTFPDLSLSIIKLLGRGEYVATAHDQESEGHFGLAVGEYTHSTAPNRRYPDLITQRLLRAILDGEKVPYSPPQLAALAERCTLKESHAQKVERRLVKSAAALLLQHRRGEKFDGIVTGASERGVWVRIFDPPVEGRVGACAQDLDVGDKVRVKLVRTDAERGHIDFECVDHGPVGRRRRRSR